MMKTLRYSILFVLTLVCGITFAQQEPTVFWNATRLKSYSIDDVIKPDVLSYIWSEDTQNGYFKASAYYDKTNYASESWLSNTVAINLSEYTKAYLSFDHTGKFFGDITKEVSVWARSGDNDWEQLTIQNFPSNNDWTFVNSGKIDLSKFVGKESFYLAFKYTSTDAAAGTWEIKNIELSGIGTAAGSVGNPYDMASMNLTFALIEILGKSIYNIENDALFYVKAKISKIDEVSTNYGNATFWISEDGTEKDQLMVYRAKSLEKTKFTAEDEIKVGDEVIICGRAMLYAAKEDDTPTRQITSGYIYSLNGNTKAGETPEPTVKEISVADALTIINALENGKTTGEEYIVKGIVTVVDEISTSYGNATFDIVDKAGDTSVLKVYRAKDAEGQKITDAEIVKVGDEVVVQGKLQKYVKNDVVTPEVAQNGKILTVNGKSTGILNVETEEADAPVYNLSGQRVEKTVKGVYIKNGKKYIAK